LIIRPWQEFVLPYIDQPSDREIIWFEGKKCNESKSWYQTFIEYKYGWARALFGQDIKLKKSSICHILIKRLLVTTDIFLFNMGKLKLLMMSTMKF
jgi:hypothetical protein